MKKASFITMIVGFAVSVISFAVSLIFASPDYSTIKGLLHSCCYGLFYCLFFLGIAAFATGALACSFSDDVKENCTAKSIKLAFALTAVLAGCAYCALSFISCLVAVNGAYPHPLRFLLVKCFSTVGVILLLFLLAYYIIERKNKLTLKGLVSDILILIIWFYPLFITYSELVAGVKILLHG